MEYHYLKMACSKCGRPLLVEEMTNGVSHTVVLLVTCAACVPDPLPNSFIEEQPDAAADIVAWLAGLREEEAGR